MWNASSDYQENRQRHDIVGIENVRLACEQSYNQLIHNSGVFSVLWKAVSKVFEFQLENLLFQQSSKSSSKLKL